MVKGIFKFQHFSLLPDSKCHTNPSPSQTSENQILRAKPPNHNSERWCEASNRTPLGVERKELEPREPPSTCGLWQNGTQLYLQYTTLHTLHTYKSSMQYIQRFPGWIDKKSELLGPKNSTYSSSCTPPHKNIMSSMAKNGHLLHRIYLWWYIINYWLHVLYSPGKSPDGQYSVDTDVWW